MLIVRNFRKLKDEMKRTTVVHLIIILTLHLIATVLISTCSVPTLSQFEVQRPSRITMPREVKKVFIREDLITANNDKLGIKSQVLQELAKVLNNMGRFKVSVVKSLDEKPNKNWLKRIYECVYNFINTYNSYWSSSISGYSISII